jgi:hypothetical protein
LKRDRFWDGTYWDLHVFAAYREGWPDLRARVLRRRRQSDQTPQDGRDENGTAGDEADRLLSGNGLLVGTE